MFVKNRYCTLIREKGSGLSLLKFKTRKYNSCNELYISSCQYKCLIHTGNCRGEEVNALWRSYITQQKRLLRCLMYRYLMAKQFLREQAERTQKILSTEIIELAAQEGISKRTLETAKKELKIKAERCNNNWYWNLRA